MSGTPDILQYLRAMNPETPVWNSSNWQAMLEEYVHELSTIGRDPGRGREVALWVPPPPESSGLPTQSAVVQARPGSGSTSYGVFPGEGMMGGRLVADDLAGMLDAMLYQSEYRPATLGSVERLNLNRMRGPGQQYAGQFNQNADSSMMGPESRSWVRGTEPRVLRAGDSPIITITGSNIGPGQGWHASAGYDPFNPLVEDFTGVRGEGPLSPMARTLNHELAHAFHRRMARYGPSDAIIADWQHGPVRQNILDRIMAGADPADFPQVESYPWKDRVIGSSPSIDHVSRVLTRRRHAGLDSNGEPLGSNWDRFSMDDSGRYTDRGSRIVSRYPVEPVMGLYGETDPLESLATTDDVLQLEKMAAKNNRTHPGVEYLRSMNPSSDALLSSWDEAATAAAAAHPEGGFLNGPKMPGMGASLAMMLAPIAGSLVANKMRENGQENKLADALQWGTMGAGAGGFAGAPGMVIGGALGALKGLGAFG